MCPVVIRCKRPLIVVVGSVLSTTHRMNYEPVKLGRTSCELVMVDVKMLRQNRILEVNVTNEQVPRCQGHSKCQVPSAKRQL